jgi:hypothetical protein
MSVMSNKLYETPVDIPEKVNEPVTVYERRPSTAETVSSDEWNPNVPFHGTQEEWWSHFHRIEEGQFYPVSETHKRVIQWLDNQEK